MIFRFQYVAEDGPQDLGEGEGSGGNAVDDAISDLAEKRGESLPAGEYRYRPLDTPEGEWGTLILDASGNVMRPS